MRNWYLCIFAICTFLFLPWLVPNQNQSLTTSASVQDESMFSPKVVQTNATSALDRIDQRTLPLNQTYTYSNTGTGVNVYVLDGGIAVNNPEFGGRARTADNPVSPCSVNLFHGTGMALIIGGNTDGVAKNSIIHDVRVICEQSTDAQNIRNVISGVKWVTDNHVKPAVINMSLGFYDNPNGNPKGIDELLSELEGEVKRAIEAGITVVIASGKETLLPPADIVDNISPARVPEAITVSSMNQSNDTWGGISKGGLIDILAPGDNVATSIGSISGTSPACALVTGVVAKYLETHPHASPATVQQVLTSSASSITIPPTIPVTNKLLFSDWISVSPTSQNVSGSGGTGTFSVTALHPTSDWRATSNDSWITITLGSSGIGNGTVGFSVASNPTQTSRTGTVNIGEQIVSITQAVGTGNCTYSITPNSASFEAVGGNGTINLTTNPNTCSWTALSSESWLIVTSFSSGNGNAAITYQVATNTNIDSRTATITVEGQPHTVTQSGTSSSPPCTTFVISPASRNFPNTGGTGNISLTTDCNWSVSSNVPWITLPQTSGSGSQAISYTVASNVSNTSARIGTITLTGGGVTQTHTVYQAAGTGSGCVAIAPQSQSASSSGGNFSVTVTSTCAWAVHTTSVTPSWITNISPTSGTGNGVVTYIVLPNNSSSSRSGSFEIGEGVNSRTHSVVQQGNGCEYSVSPTEVVIPGSGGSGSFTITASGTPPFPGASCGWVLENSSLAQNITPTQGTGGGTVTFTVPVNPSPTERTGFITFVTNYAVGQFRFTVNIRQLPGNCVSIFPSSASWGRLGGTGQIGVSVLGECSWTATSGAYWIQVVGIENDFEGTRVIYQVLQNTTGSIRTGTINVGGNTFTVTQRAF